ncbi:uncharacterized protein BDZ99DRAFT_545469 [Mytilinidion resinicola]|uniref:Uncharacterized protein n=1 Tax=Mytilinidion resinicola TaxID=574789 RepID=A0A6A6Y5V4_9PEZI|nr:uncharacterized protein BDZ99DRAFT_545469 [Mytilinidion resinicola]KAF2804221.1 hypothetical protein BDZ99DRAFT_545469 [Mytilinidion resinicola]
MEEAPATFFHDVIAEATGSEDNRVKLYNDEKGKFKGDAPGKSMRMAIQNTTNRKLAIVQDGSDGGRDPHIRMSSDENTEMDHVSILGAVNDGYRDVPGILEQLPKYLPVITPPTEAGPLHWRDSSHVKTVTPSAVDNPDPNLESPPMSTTSPADEAVAGEAVTSEAAASDGPPESTSSSDEPWVLKIKTLLAGHMFPDIIDTIHRKTPTVPTTWMNVYHAVPSRYRLDEVPTSPPSTSASRSNTAIAPPSPLAIANQLTTTSAIL